MHPINPVKSGGTSLDRTVHARRATVVWISLLSAVALSIPLLAHGIQYLIVVPALAVALGTMNALTLRVAIWVDARNRLHFRYLVYSFSTKLHKIQSAPTPKYDYRRDDELGFDRLYQGTRVPSFMVGWFLLRNGAVAFACVSRKRRARAFRMRKGLYLVVDPCVARRIQSAAAAARATRRRAKKTGNHV